MVNLHKTKCLHHVLIVIFLLIFTNNCRLTGATTLEEDLPLISQLCDDIICPPESEMQCPEDSAIRETLSAVDLIKSTNASPSSTTTNLPEKAAAFNISSIPDDLYAQCCLSKKCICKTCYIPDCDTDNGEVVIELEPEAMDTPGQCCGQYECRAEPNCTVELNTEFYWLQHCQRCQCLSGSRICHRSCDENAEDEKDNAFCQSKIQNMLYADGESWKDGCYECECVKGEDKCVIPFCGNVNCPTERQVTLKDSCCPTCWPEGHPMPHEKPRGGYDDGYGDYNLKEHDDHRLPNIPIESEQQTQTHLHLNITTTTESQQQQQQQPEQQSIASQTSTTTAEKISPEVTTTATALQPCRNDGRDFPAVVEVVQQPHFNDLMYYVIIAVLVVIIGALLAYVRQLRAKQRSYRPVSNFDDKV